MVSCRRSSHGLPLHELSAHDWQRFLFKYGIRAKGFQLQEESQLWWLHGATRHFFCRTA